MPGATREEMRDAKLPIQYRDSCAHLLIPLNRCRFETYYMPWKCEVRDTPGRTQTHAQTQTTDPDRREREGPEGRATRADRLTTRSAAGRETQLRKVPVRRVQEARRQDERAPGGQGRGAEQLREQRRWWPGEERGRLAVYICGRTAVEAGNHRRQCTASDTHPSCCRDIWSCPVKDQVELTLAGTSLSPATEVEHEQQSRQEPRGNQKLSMWNYRSILRQRVRALSVGRGTAPSRFQLCPSAPTIICSAVGRSWNSSQPIHYSLIWQGLDIGSPRFPFHRPGQQHN
jgi:hypothetical protein